MKISFLNKYIQPKNPEPVKQQSRHPEISDNRRSSQRSKVDSTEISANYTSYMNDKKLQQAKSSILYDVSVSTSPSRIAELKLSVQNGTYKISADDLADTILKK